MRHARQTRKQLLHYHRPTSQEADRIATSLLTVWVLRTAEQRTVGSQSNRRRRVFDLRPTPVGRTVNSDPCRIEYSNRVARSMKAPLKETTGGPGNTRSGAVSSTSAAVRVNSATNLGAQRVRQKFSNCVRQDREVSSLEWHEVFADLLAKVSFLWHYRESFPWVSSVGDRAWSPRENQRIVRIGVRAINLFPRLDSFVVSNFLGVVECG